MGACGLRGPAGGPDGAVAAGRMPGANARRVRSLRRSGGAAAGGVGRRGAGAESVVAGRGGRLEGGRSALSPGRVVGRSDGPVHARAARRLDGRGGAENPLARQARIAGPDGARHGRSGLPRGGGGAPALDRSGPNGLLRLLSGAAGSGGERGQHGSHASVPPDRSNALRVSPGLAARPAASERGTGRIGGPAGRSRAGARGGRRADQHAVAPAGRSAFAVTADASGGGRKSAAA